jgi:hypothetical protein
MLTEVPSALPDDDDDLLPDGGREDRAAAPVSGLPATPPPAAARPPRQARKPGQRISAREAVLAARASSRREPRAWVPHSVQVPDALYARLLERIVADQETADDFQLGQLHYFSAAFAMIPSSPEAAAEWAAAWRARGMEYRSMVKRGSSVRREAERAMRQLATRLKMLPVRAWLWEVEAEALARLLDQLDAANET